MAADGHGGAVRQRDSLLRLLAPVPTVPRHLSDLEPRGDSITRPGEWNGVGWVEDGPAGPLRDDA